MLRVGLTGGIGSGKSTASRPAGRARRGGHRLRRARPRGGRAGYAGTRRDRRGVRRRRDRSRWLAGPARLGRGVRRPGTARPSLNGDRAPAGRRGRAAVAISAGAGPDAVVVQDVPLLVENDLAADLRPGRRGRRAGRGPGGAPDRAARDDRRGRPGPDGCPGDARGPAGGGRHASSTTPVLSEDLIAQVDELWTRLRGLAGRERPVGSRRLTVGAVDGRMRPITDLAAPGRAVRGDLRLHPVRRPADRDRRSRAAGSRPASQHRAARRHRHRQVGDDGLADRAAAAADPGDGAQQDARRPAGQRVPRAAAQQRGRVLRLLLRLLPARGLRPADRHLHREGLLDQRRGRAAAALGDQLAADPARRHRGRHGVLHLRPGHPAGVRRPHGPAQGRRQHRARRAAAPLRRDAVHPQRPGLHPRHLPGPGRHRRDLPGLRGARDPDRDVRRRDRAALHPAPADRRGRPRGDRDVRLPGHPLRRRPGAHGAGDHGASRPSWTTGSPSWSGRASCSRPSGCGCARPTTSR